MDKYKDNRLGENIKKIRKFAGMSQADLGDLFSTGKKTIGDYENGRSLPNIYFIRDFCNYFGITIESLLENESDQNPGAAPELRITSLDGDELEVVKILRSLDEDYRKKALQVISVFRTVAEPPEIKKAE